MSQTIQDACDVLRNAGEKLRDAIHTEFKIHKIEKVLIKLHDFVYVPHTHRCFSGTQAYCYNDCTIAADTNTREVFHKCIKGGIQRLGVDTAVFYPITASTFDKTTAINDVVGERLFAALGITTPDDYEEHTHECYSGKQLGCEYPCTVSADPGEHLVFYECLRGVTHAICVETVVFERMEGKQ